MIKNDSYLKHTKYIPEQLIEKLIRDINCLAIQYKFNQNVVDLLKSKSEISEANKREYQNFKKKPALQKSFFDVAYANISILKDIFPDLIDTGHIMATTEEHES